MPKGTRRTSYVRDNRGRFASTPGGGAPKRPPAKRVSRGTNRLTRDNSGRITSVGGNGATARGGRLRTGAGNLRARQTDRLKGAPQGVLSRGGKARGKVAAAKKPVGWAQSPEARKDRVDPVSAANRKDYARRLRALPKAAQRSIQVERSARKRKFFVAGNTAAQLSNLSEGRMQLIANAGKRKNKLTPGQIDAITRSMTQSARRLKVGLATGNRGRMKYNPKALQLAPSTAARTIRGARVGGVARKGKATQPSRPDTAQANIPMRGARSRQLDASISRAVKEVQAAERARLMKPKEQVRAEAATRKAAKEAAAAAKPKRAPRSAESLRLSRAKQVEKRRSITTNPAGNRADAAGRMAANAARTQQRALAFYGRKKPKKVAPPPKPAAPKRVTAGRLAGTVAKPRGLKPGALKASRIARGRAKRAAEPLGTRLNRVYIRVKAIEARNDPRTLRGKNTRRNDKSFGIARKASGFLGQGNKAWSDRARLSTGRRSAATSGLRPGRKITIKVKRTPKLTKQDKAFESVMNLKGVTDFSSGKQRQVWIDAKMMTGSRREKLGLSGRMRAESDRYYAREDVNPMTGMAGYFMGTRSGWLNSQPKTRQGVISRPRRRRKP